MLRGLLVLAWCALVGACGGPDLGQSPFFCNNGSPKCPGGYVCVGKHPGRCVREGAVGDMQAADFSSFLDAGADQLIPWPDDEPAADSAPPRDSAARH